MSTVLLKNKRELDSLCDAQVGDELEFFYYGNGANSQLSRTAKVLEILDDGILGMCHLTDGPRHFKSCEARDVFKLDGEQSEIVDFGVARRRLVSGAYISETVAAILTGEQLAQLYKDYIADDESEVVYDSETGNISVSKIAKTLTWGGYYSATNVTSEVDVYVGNYVKMTIEIDSEDNTVCVDGVSVTPSEFIEKLQDLLS